MISLHTLSPSTSRRHPKRVGRGNSSGKGTTAGRGTKGQRARTGGRRRALRRSLRALIERTPKMRGFRSIRPSYAVVSLADLARIFPDGQVITPALLSERQIVGRTRVGLKVIGSMSLKKRLTIKAHKFTAGAKAAIEKAGGQAVTIS